MTVENIADQIRRFIDRHVSNDVFVVGVLRYGAHLPSIYRQVDPHGKQISLILSHFLDFFPDSFFRDKQFLLLDDTVYRGKHLQDLLVRLCARGVTRDQVTTAALVVHEESDWKPDFWLHELSGHEYIIWKQDLASLAKQQMRPIDGDHPLYYFKVTDLLPGQFLLLLKRFGVLHAAGEDWDRSVLTFALDVDSSVLADIADSPDVHVPGICKLRFYWQQSGSDSVLTVVPIVFSRIRVTTASTSLFRRVCTELGISPEPIERIASERVRFYYFSRAISALLLLRLLRQVRASFVDTTHHITSLPPEIINSPIEYVLPDEYLAFYEGIRERLDKALSSTREYDLPLADQWKLPDVATERLAPLDRHIPQKYDVLEFIARDANPVEYDGVVWQPKASETPAISFEEMAKWFRDPLFVSSSLDDLLDAGLLKAGDHYLHDGEFARAFQAGGEYNALRVSRLADALRMPSPTIDPDLIKEESLEFWHLN